MKAATASIDRRFARLGRSVAGAPAAPMPRPAPWSPPPLTDLIGRIDIALRERAAH